MRSSLLALTLLLSSCSQISDWISEKNEEKLPGERIALIEEDSGFSVDSDMAEVAVGVPPAQTNPAWPQSGMTGNLGLKELKGKLVSIGSGSSSDESLLPPPVIGEAAAYFLDAKAVVYAVKLDGASLWEVRLDKSGKVLLDGGLALDDGKLFVALSNGVALALDAASGKELWQRNLRVPLRAAPRAQGERVFFATADSQLLALDSKTGATLWQHRGTSETSNYLGAATPAVAGDKIAAAYSSGELFVLRTADGQPVWDANLSLIHRTSAAATLADADIDPVIAGGQLYAASRSGLLAAFEISSGRQLWEEPLVLADSVWAAGDYIYLVTRGGKAAALNKDDGRVKWITDLGAEQKKKEIWHGPVMAGGSLWITQSSGTLLVLSPTDGKVQRKFDFTSGVNHAPIFAGGVGYFYSQSAKLYRLD